MWDKTFGVLAHLVLEFKDIFGELFPVFVGIDLLGGGTVLISRVLIFALDLCSQNHDDTKR